MSLRDTLAARWSHLSEAAQQHALQSGRARPATLAFKVEDAEPWRPDWRPDGGSWPCYTLAITLDGQPLATVTGWHYVGPWTGDQPEDWTTRPDDGADDGTPQAEADGTTLRITPGANLEGPPVEIPLATLDPDGIVRAITQTPGEIQDLIDQAAGNADHGSEPDLDELDPQDDEVTPSKSVIDDARYTVEDYRVRTYTLRCLAKYPNGTRRDDDREIKTYLFQGFVVVDQDNEILTDVCKEEDAWAEADLPSPNYKSEAEARLALDKAVRTRLQDLDAPDGLSYGRDADGLYMAPRDHDDPDDRYHLDDDQVARLCRNGWIAVLDDVVDALGRRRTLAAARHWQAEMDRIVAQDDPYVTLDDSLQAGNCRPGTLRFRDQLAAHLNATGEIGAARASTILALRDDTFTRRAVRLAAARRLSER